MNPVVIFEVISGSSCDIYTDKYKVETNVNFRDKLVYDSSNLKDGTLPIYTKDSHIPLDSKE